MGDSLLERFDRGESVLDECDLSQARVIMPEPEPNPHVALNNARLLQRPTGDLAELWQRWARGVERDAQAKRASDKKKRQEREATAQ